MARSPLTLAASVASALPRIGVVGVGILTEGAAGRYDSAVVDLDDGRRVVVRVPADAATAPELAAEVRALRALTPGVRALLPFHAPEVLGETGLEQTRAVVVDFLPGYRVDAAHLPPGHGAASSVGEALAAIHGLPLSIVRTEGLPVRTPQQVRDDVSRLLDRAEATRRVPTDLLSRWRRAVLSDALWRFESAVVLGGASASSFVFDEVDDAPAVTGMLEWHGLSVGDPATDLQWLASAPAAVEDVYAAYAQHSRRAPDGLLRERARLYAELEFAKWLVHGNDVGSESVVDDAVALLTALSEGVQGDDLVLDAALGVDDAIALLDRVPDAAPPAADTSMQTDAYDPAQLSLFLAEEEDALDRARTTERDGATGLLDDHPDDAEAPDPFPDTGRTDDEEADARSRDAETAWSDRGLAGWSESASEGRSHEAEDERQASVLHPADDVSTAPIDISGSTPPSVAPESARDAAASDPDTRGPLPPSHTGPTAAPLFGGGRGADDEDAQASADRSAEAALRRWTDAGD